MIAYKNLFAAYTEDGHTLENTFRYLAKEAKDNGISSEIMEMAINDIFSQIQHGKEFPKDKCPCGCGIDKAATALIHAIKQRMIDLSNEVTIEIEKVMQRKYNIMLESEMKKISKFDKQYIKMNTPRWYNRLFTEYKPVHLM